MEITLFAGAGIALLILVVVIYNGIVTRKNAVERAWADVITYERQKNKVMPTIEGIAKSYQGFEESILTRIVELRNSLERISPNKVDTTALADIERQSASLLAGLRVTVENYPDLKAAPLLQGVMREFSELQQNIAAALTIFNRNVEEFNSGIQIFPASVVNGLINRENKINTFSDSEAAKEFEYSPNL